MVKKRREAEAIVCGILKNLMDNVITAVRVHGRQCQLRIKMAMANMSSKRRLKG